MIPVVGFVLVEWGFAPSFLILAILHMLFCIVDAYEAPPLQLQVWAFLSKFVVQDAFFINLLFHFEENIEDLVVVV